MPGDPSHLHRSSSSCTPSWLGGRRPLYAALAMIGGVCVLQRMPNQQLSPQVTTVAPIVFSSSSFSEGPSSDRPAEQAKEPDAPDRIEPPSRVRKRRKPVKNRRRDVAEESESLETEGEHPTSQSNPRESPSPAAKPDEVASSLPGQRCQEPLPAIKSCLDHFLDSPLQLNSARSGKGVIQIYSGGQFGNQVR